MSVHFDTALTAEVPNGPPTGQESSTWGFSTAPVAVISNLTTAQPSQGPLGQVQTLVDAAVGACEAHERMGAQMSVALQRSPYEPIRTLCRLTDRRSAAGRP